MSRPSPRVLIKKLTEDQDVSHEILECQGLWAVLYQGKPFNAVAKKTFFCQTKYKKTVFPTPGQAAAQCRRLNSLYNTNDFTVEKIL